LVEARFSVTLTLFPAVSVTVGLADSEYVGITTVRVRLPLEAAKLASPL
jgi:hypothetical protein